MLAVSACDSGAAGARPTTRGSAEVPSLGLRFNVFTGSTPQTLPPPTVWRRTFGDGRSDDVRQVQDLWLRGEWRGKWADRNGNVVLLAEPTCLPDLSSAPDKVSDAEYRDLTADSPAPTNDVLLAQWLNRFTGATVSGEPRSIAAALRMDRIRSFRLQSEGGAAVAYAFGFRPMVGGIDPARNFVLIAQSRDLDPAALASMAEREILPSLTPVPGAASATSGRSAAAMPGVSRSPAAGASGATAATAMDPSRTVALRSIEGLKDWWAASSTNFLVLTDLKRARKTWVDQFLLEVERIWSIAGKLTPASKPIQAAGIIRIFSEEADYVNYVGPAMSWSGGMWSGAKHELIIRSQDNLSPSELRKWLSGVVYHETTHQYLAYAFGLITPPAWYNEGHATFMEGIEWKRTGYEIGEPEQYAQAMNDLVSEGLVDFAPLVEMTYEQFYGSQRQEDQNRNANYVMAWGLVYYLRKGAAANGSLGFDKILPRFLEAVKTSSDGEAASRAAFEGADIKALNADFVAFWKSGNRRAAARRLGIP